MNKANLIEYRKAYCALLDKPDTLTPLTHGMEATENQRKCIVIEVTDFVALATEERRHGAAGCDAGLKLLTLNLSDARMLTHNLITRLAQFDDEIAIELREKMIEVMNRERG